MESPIDIVTADMKVDITSPALTFAYHAGDYELENNGHTIEAVPDEDDNNIVTFGGTEYVLQQFHFHAHSEHLIDGAAADAELHLVHKSAAGDVLVLGVLLEEGAANSSLDDLFAQIPEENGKEVELETPIDASDLVPADSASARYEGSLTTPPCTQGVQWNVFLEPQSISPAQLSTFTKVYPDNHRPVQPLHHREVTEIPAD
ncbi:carbonic anhydrase family protein [Microbacterium oxydans]|nr:carbonic anhydrase family protein [Microbacterium oxydans]